MKRRKIALAMATAMILTSVQPYGITGYAEDVILEEELLTDQAEAAPQQDAVEESVPETQELPEVLVDETELLMEEEETLSEEELWDSLFEEETETVEEPTLLEEEESGLQAYDASGKNGQIHLLKGTDTLTLQVAASTDPGYELSYSWYYDWEPCDNDSDDPSELVLAPVVSGTYVCSVSDGRTSKDVEFNVYIHDSLYAYDASGNNGKICLEMGTPSVTLEVGVQAISESISYQWYLYHPDTDTEEEKPGDTDAPFRMTLSPVETGQYKCKVSDGNAAEEVWFYVDVNTGLKAWSEDWESQPTGDEEDDWDAYVYLTPDMKDPSVSVKWDTKSDRNVTFQWTKGSDIQYKLEGETNSSLAITPGMEGPYNCEVSDGYRATSVPFWIFWNSGFDASKVTETYQTVNAGEEVFMAVKASTEAEGLSYQWYRCYTSEEGDDYEKIYEEISGANQPFLRLASAEESAVYECRISDGYNSASYDFYVTVHGGNNLNVENSFQSITIGQGQDAVLSVEAASGRGGLSYKWYWYDYDMEEYSDPIAGAEESTYTVTYEELVNHPDCYVKCRVSDGTETKECTFRIVCDTSVSLDLSDYNSASGWDAGMRGFFVNGLFAEARDSLTLKAPASTVSGTLQYQWYRASAEPDEYDERPLEPLYGETAENLVISSYDGDTARDYRCVVTNGITTTFVHFAILSRRGFAVSGNRAVKAAADGTATLTVNVVNTTEDSVTYVWEKAATDASGGITDWDELETETSSSLAVSNVTGYQFYRCTARLSGGREESITYVVYPEDQPDGDSFAQASDWNLPDGQAYAVLMEKGRKSYFKLVVNKTGSYIFRAADILDENYDFEGVLYDADGTVLEKYSGGKLADNDDTYLLVKGKTYYFSVGYTKTFRTGCIKVRALAENYYHSWDNGTVTKEPTCTTVGIRTYHCTDEGCDETTTAMIPKVPHVFTNYVSNNDGTETAVCDVCKEATDTRNTTQTEHQHQWSEELVVQIPATCTEDGLGYYRCTGEGCSASKAEVIPALGHDFVEQPDVPATDTADGKKYEKCSRCGEEHIISVFVRREEQTKIDEVKEILKDTETTVTASEIVEKIAAIDNQALIDSDSVDTVVDLETKLIAAQEEGKAAIAATTKDLPESIGADKVAVEGAAVTAAAVLQDSAQVEVDPKETYSAQVQISNVQADTEKATYTLDISLNIVDSANNVVVPNAELAAPIRITLPIPAEYQGKEFKLYHQVGESLTEISYTLVSAAQTITFSTPSLSPFILQADPCANGHDYGEWKTTVEATCTQAGMKTRKCSRCEHSESQAVDPKSENGHTWDGGTVTKAATCVEDGIMTYTCTVCYETKTEAIPATGQHTWDGGKVTKAATCGTDGIMTYTCTVCGGTKTEVIHATGQHSYGDYAVTRQATVKAEGVKVHTCRVCGHQESASVQKLTPTIQVNATSVPLKTGQSTTKLKVTGLAAGDSVKSWTSQNTKIVKVSSTGKLTAQKKTGKTTVTITLASGLQKKITVTVQSGKVATSKISGVSKKLTLKKGAKTTLKPVITPITTTDKVTYTSSNKKVATVSSKGVVTAKAAGTAKITITSGKKKATVTVTVPKTKTTAISGVKSAVSLKVGKTYKLAAKLSPKNSDEKITYSTSNKKVATVDSKGKITAKKAGTATITVKSGSVKVKCVVTVKK